MKLDSQRSPVALFIKKILYFSNFILLCIFQQMLYFFTPLSNNNLSLWAWQLLSLLVRKMKKEQGKNKG